MANPGVRRRWDKLWAGIDPETKAFCERMEAEGRIAPQYKSASRDWFISLRDAGLSTSLDADFNDPPMAAHLDEMLRGACYPGLEKERKRHLDRVRRGLKIYVLASERQYGLRKLAVPPIAIPIPRHWSVTEEHVRAALPQADRERLRRIASLIYASAKRQWQGFGAEKLLGKDGRYHKATVSVSHAPKLEQTVIAFLRHAYYKQWKPFTLHGLLTPDRVTDFLYYGWRWDGGPRSIATVKRYEGQLLDFFYRGRAARPDAVVVITDEQEAKIRTAMLEEQPHKDQWNVSDPSLSNTGKAKWYPERHEVESAMKTLEEEFDRIEERHARGATSDRKYWLELRNLVLTLCTIYCMWRVDTVATISLLQVRRDRVTGAVVDENGFMVIEKIARAKNPKGDWYPFVPELILPPNVVRLIARLLELEGRSFEQPLRDGEKPIRLSAANGDRWGGDVLPTGDLTVVPLFRKRRERPEPLGYGAIQDILEDQLERLHFGANNPHTFRATGAIYWRFIQEMPEDLVMTLGLWEDAKTLRENYARMGSLDKRASMARYIPLVSGAVPPRQRGRREHAASRALTILGKMLEKTTNAYEARRYLKDLRRACEEIDQTIAGELGLQWEAMRPDRFEPGELERVDAALRGIGYERGIASVLGRDVFAADALESRARAELATGVTPKRLRRVMSIVEQRAALPAPHVDEADSGTDTAARSRKKRRAA